MGEWVLGLFGGEDRPFAGRALRGYQVLVLVCMAVDSWDNVSHGPTDTLLLGHLAAAFVLTVAVGLSFSAPWGRVACAAGLAATAFEWISAFPLTANHHYLALLCLGLMLLPRRDSSQAANDEAVMVLRSLRWVAAIGLAGAGIQKLLFGYWFGGELLAYAVNQRESFAAMLGVWIPGDEVQRLRSLPVDLASGPFRVDSWWLVAISNLTWLAEIGLAIMLIVRPTRRTAVILTLLLLLLIQLGAREIFFGGLMAGLVILAWPGNLLGRLLPIFLVFYAYVLATILGFVPAWSFT